MVVVVVVVRTCVLHEGVCPATRTLAPNSGGRTPESKLPASPPPLPRPNGGRTPGRVPVYTAQKKPSRHTMSCNCGDLRSFLQVWTPCPVVTTTGMSPLSKNCTCARTTKMIMSPYRYTSHFSLRHLSFNVNREKL